ncbi:MAG: hypothetical protein L0G27_12245 [Paracoccus sp. (in: a-proteobacteria)]|nr:hypothetical protein [Paracoccus sp. (in: a-proteobacteria)]
MNSRRTRMAALSTIAILTVVGLVTLAAYRTLQHTNAQDGFDAVARQIDVMTTLAQDLFEQLIQAGGVISDAPALAETAPRTTQLLSSAMERIGAGSSVTVSRPQGGRVRTVSVNLDAVRWLLVEMPDLSSPDGG